MNIQDQRVMEEIFSAAKKADEFEYACTLLRVSSLKDVGWDAMYETWNTVSDATELARTSDSPHTAARMGLLAYCHVYECKAVFEVFANMIGIAGGVRFNIAPFDQMIRATGKTPATKRYSYPSSTKIKYFVVGEARNAGFNELGDLMERRYHDGLRNAFSHSDYTLFNNELRSEGTWFESDGIRSHVLSLGALGNIINNGLKFFATFLQVMSNHRMSYSENKTVKCRFKSDTVLSDMTLLATPERGLHGFRSL